MMMKSANAYKCLRVFYNILYTIHSMPSTCFACTCGHPQVGALQTTYYKTFWTKAQMEDIKF